MEAKHLVCPASVQPLTNTLRTHRSNLLLVHCGKFRQVVESLSIVGICRQPEYLFFSPAFVRTRDCAQSLWCVYTTTFGGEIAVEETFKGAGIANEPSQRAAKEERNPQDSHLVVVMDNNDNSNLTAPVTPSQHKQPVQLKGFIRPRVSLDALMPGAVFPGKVTNVTEYGAFVDLGAFTTGLVHISNISDSPIRALEDAVQVGQRVMVKILSVNKDANRISLMLVSKGEWQKDELATCDLQGSVPQEQFNAKRISQDSDEYKVSLDDLKPGAVFPGRVTKITKFGAFVALGATLNGLIHISSLSNGFVQNVEDVVLVGQRVNVQILGVNADSRRIFLKLVSDDKQVEEQPMHKILKHADAMEEDLSQNKQATVNVLEEKRWNTKRHSKDYKVGLKDLKPGAVFTGKVTNVQSYGAFVDIGAFNSGLLHIKNLRNSYVRAVEDVVQLGQEVVVEVLSVDVDAKHIFLRLKSANTHFEKGEIVNGVVKKKMKAGFVIGLQDGHEGFLPASEVLSGGGTVPDSYFKINQEIPVRILRTRKSNVMLTMKTKDELNLMNMEYFNQDMERATSPFEIAFRRDIEMTKYLEEREKLQPINAGEAVDIITFA